MNILRNGITFLIFSFLLSATNVHAEWQWSNPANAPIAINDVVWSGSQFVAVGADGGVRVGANSQNWADYSTPTQYPLSGVAWNGSKYVAVGGVNIANKLEHVILDSIDGKNWRIVKNGAQNPLNAIASDGSQFIAVGLFAVMKSTDGENWTKQSPNTDIFTDIIWTGSAFVLVGERGKIMSSPDGDIWTDYSIVTNDTFNSITWSGSTFVVVGSLGSIYTGVDLAALTEQTILGNHIEVMWSDVVGKFIIFSGSTLLTSIDGITWAEEQSFAPPAPFFNALAENGTTVVAVGERGETYTSTDASFWATPLNKLQQDAHLKSIIWGNEQYVAVGRGGNSGTQIWTSLDAVNWSSFNNGGNFSVPIVDIAYNGTRFVTVSGRESYAATTFTSTDLINWKINNASNSVRGMNGIIWADTQFIGAGYNNSIATSPDGETWKRLDLSAAGITNTDFNNIYYDGSTLIALGRESVNPTWVGTILTSDDKGQTWIKQTANTSSGLYAMAKNNTVYVAVGGEGIDTQVILTSPDLVNWTKRDSGTAGILRSIIWDGTQFIAPISDVAISKNRKNLTGGILTSADGETWVFESIPGTSALNGVVEQKGQTILVGNNSNILRKGQRAPSDGNGIVDNEAPVVIPPDNITINAGTGNNASIVRITHPDIILFLGAVYAEDNVVVIGEIKNDAPNEFVSSAVTRVTFTARDAAGNVGTATATVTINGGINNQDAIGIPDGAPRGSGGLPVEASRGALNISMLFLLCLLPFFRKFSQQHFAKKT